MSTNVDHFDQLYPGMFLKAGDFAAGPGTLTIADIELTELEGERGKKMSGVVHFREDRRGLVLNKTNGLCLRKMFGDRPKDWEGKRVVLHMDNNVKFGKERVSAVRVLGSPDIPNDITFEIVFRRKKPFQYTLKATGKRPAPPPEPKLPQAEKQGARPGRTLTDAQLEELKRLRLELAPLVASEQATEAEAMAEAKRLSPVRIGTYDADIAKLKALIAEKSGTASGEEDPL